MAFAAATSQMAAAWNRSGLCDRVDGVGGQTKVDFRRVASNRNTNGADRDGPRLSRIEVGTGFPA